MGHGFLLARAPWGFCTEGRDWSARQLGAGTNPSADHVAGQVQRTSGCCRQSPKGGAFITAYRGGKLEGWPRRLPCRGNLAYLDIGHIGSDMYLILVLNIYTHTPIHTQPFPKCWIRHGRSVIVVLLIPPNLCTFSLVVELKQERLCVYKSLIEMCLMFIDIIAYQL